MSATEPLWSLSAVQQAGLLSRGEVSSEQLVRAHLERIAEVEPRVHAFAVVLREQALRDARDRDRERKEGAACGPLHGLPVSVKECFELEGHPVTLGVPARASHKSASTAVLPRMMQEAGAVLLGRGNLSQLMLSFECDNPYYGRTRNPFSLEHAPGGSSGGEAAALASGCVPLGIGTDIGGSIRIPCHYSGVAGLKPTMDRWSVRGVVPSMAGQEAVRGQSGPMARTVDDVALLFGALDPERMSRLDGRVPPLPILAHTEVDLRSLRVGVYHHDGLLTPSQALVRAVDQASNALAAAGCRVTHFVPPGIPEVIFTYFAALSSDDGHTLRAMLQGGPVESNLASLLRLAKIPRPARLTLARALRLTGEPRVARLLEGMGAKPVERFWQLVGALRAWRLAAEDAMEREGLDVLLCPAMTTPAVPHGLGKDFALAASYTMLWNLAPLPAGVVPVTRVRAEECERPHGGDRLDKRAAEVDRRSAGLPVGVQVVGRAWREHHVLAAMREIERDAQGRPDALRTPVDPR